MAATRFMLIRHGETEYNKIKKLQGTQNSPLTEKGRDQAKLIGKRLSGSIPDYFYSSDLGRARETAGEISLFINKEPVLLEEMRERAFGIFEGENFEELKDKYPEVWGKHRNGGLDYKIPEGESKKDVMLKVDKVLRDLGEKHPNSTVAIVTHGGTISYFLQYILGFPSESSKKFPVKNCSINTVIYKDNDFIIDSIGDTLHLNPEFSGN